jgi:hypothetical protein
MAEISYRRHRVPPVIIQHAVWLYLRFTLRYRDVEELLAERGLDISYETVRCWVLKFGPVIARPLRRCLGRARGRDRQHEGELGIGRQQGTGNYRKGTSLALHPSRPYRRLAADGLNCSCGNWWREEEFGE